MFGHKKTPAPSVIPAHIRTRVARIETHELIDWADQALYTAGRYIGLHRRDHRPESLEDAVEAARVLLAIMDEMTARSSGSHPH